jgi:hypothetical protein
MKNKNLKEFTLIEMLIFVSLTVILAIIVSVVINPGDQSAKTNSSKIKADINSVLSAIYQFKTSSTVRSALPSCTINSVITAIPECNNPLESNGNFDGAIELGTAPTSFDCSTFLTPSFLVKIPINPTSTYDEAKTGYWVCQDTSGSAPRIVVIAEGTEISTTDSECQIPGTTTPAICVSG